jgi:hypothetical protein
LVASVGNFYFVSRIRVKENMLDPTDGGTTIV